MGQSETKKKGKEEEKGNIRKGKRVKEEEKEEKGGNKDLKSLYMGRS